MPQGPSLHYRSYQGVGQKCKSSFSDINLLLKRVKGERGLKIG